MPAPHPTTSALRSTPAPVRHRRLARLFLVAGIVLGAASFGSAQGRPVAAIAVDDAVGRPWKLDRALEFLAPYGLHDFSAHYFDALQTFVAAQHGYATGNFAGATAVLDELWSRHPVGDPSWAALPSQPFGINLGTPPCYYGLRMLTDMAGWRVAHPGLTRVPRTARLTVVLVGQSSGIEPQTALPGINSSSVMCSAPTDASRC